MRAAAVGATGADVPSRWSRKRDRARRPAVPGVRSPASTIRDGCVTTTSAPTPAPRPRRPRPARPGRRGRVDARAERAGRPFTDEPPPRRNRRRPSGRSSRGPGIVAHPPLTFNGSHERSRSSPSPPRPVLVGAGRELAVPGPRPPPSQLEGTVVSVDRDAQHRSAVRTIYIESRDAQRIKAAGTSTRFERVTFGSLAARAQTPTSRSTAAPLQRPLESPLDVERLGRRRLARAATTDRDVGRRLSRPRRQRLSRSSRSRLSRCAQLDLAARDRHGDQVRAVAGAQALAWRCGPAVAIVDAVTDSGSPELAACRPGVRTRADDRALAPAQAARATLPWRIVGMSTVRCRPGAAAGDGRS